MKGKQAFAPRRAFSNVALLMLVLSGCSGGGDSATSGVPPVALPPPPPSNTPPPPPPPPTSVGVASSCPADTATNVGTNSQAIAAYPEAINPQGLTQSTFTIRCNGQPVDGQVTVDGNRLRLAISSSLPPSSTCTAQIAPGTLTTTSGHPLAASSWQFTTADGTRNEWAFSSPQVVASSDTNVFTLKHALWAEDNPVIIYWGSPLPQPTVSVSADGGLTYSTGSPTTIFGPYEATLQESDAAYSDGRLHLAWRVLPYNVYESEMLYSHSTDSLTSFSPSQFLSGPADGFQDNSPSLSVSGPTVRVVWQESCGDPPCAGDNPGLHLAVLDNNGDSVTSNTRITSGTEEAPKAAEINGHLLIARALPDTYQFHEVFQLVDHDDGDRLIASVSNTGQRVWYSSVSKLDEHGALLTWEEGAGTGDHTYYVASYDGDSRTLGASRLLLSTPVNQYRYQCARISPDGSGNLVWTTALGQYQDVPFGSSVPTTRIVRFSRDRGATFGEDISLDFMLPSVAGSTANQLYDDVCPVVAARQNRLLLVGWVRYGGDHKSSVMSAVGHPRTPCSS